MEPNTLTSQVPSGKYRVFFEQIVDYVYTFLLHVSQNPAVAEDCTVETFSILFRKMRWFPWRQDLLTFGAAMNVGWRLYCSRTQWKDQDETAEYRDILFRTLSMKDNKFSRTSVDALAHLLHGLHRMERRDVIFHVVMQLPKEKVLQIVGIGGSPMYDQSRKNILHVLAMQLVRYPVLQGHDMLNMCQPLSRSLITHEERQLIWSALSTRIQQHTVMALQSIAVLTSVLLFPLALYGSVFLVPSISFRQERQLIAALELTIAEDALRQQQIVADLEQALEGVIAYHATRELAAISTELAVFAYREHDAFSNRANDILKRFDVTEQVSMHTGGTFAQCKDVP